MLLFLIILFLVTSNIYTNSLELMIDEIINNKNKITKDEILQFSKIKSEDLNINIGGELVDQEKNLNLLVNKVESDKSNVTILFL